MTHNTPSLKHFERHLSVSDTQQTAIDLLTANTLLSKQKLKSAMTNGSVWLESSIGIHRLRRAKKTLNKNDKLHLYYDEIIQQTKPLTPELIADEDLYSVWNKPYGMYSQGSKWGDHCTIYRWAETHLKPERPAFIVHRLDRAASGLILLAHSKKMATIFSELFKSREINKCYKATVEGSLDDLTLPYKITSDIDGKHAVSVITDVENNTIKDNTSKLTIEIETGRKHQIRKHLSEFGYPIIGDRLYGSRTYFDNTQQQDLQQIDLQLQAISLKFICPVTQKQREYSLS